MSSPPQPAYGPRTLLSDLTTAETLLVATLRLFALPWQEPGGEHPDWRTGLRAGALPFWTATMFGSFFRVVVAATRRPLDVRCLHCLQLGYDEGRLLQVVSLLQHRRREEAQAVLESWLPPTACRFALPSAEGLARGLAQAALIIPPRHSLVPVLPPHQLQINPGLALVQ